MRIIAGKHRGRKIHVAKKSDARPTMGRAREALFNILTSGKFVVDGKSVLKDARILELFCGTGSLSMEALSRGAAYAVMIDKDSMNLGMLRQTIADLGEEKSALTIRADATNLPKAKEPCDLVFLDPPYGEGLVEPCLKTLQETGWLKAGAILIIETGKSEDFEIPENFEMIDERVYGISKIRFIQAR